MTTKNIDSIIEWFEDQGQPYYVIECKTYGREAQNLREGDIEEAAEKLKKHLDEISKDESGATHTVYVSDAPIKPGTKLKELMCMGYKAHKAPAEQREGYIPREQYYYNALAPAFENLNKKIEDLQTQIVAMKMDEAEDDTEIEEKAENNVLGALMQNPAIQNVLAGIIANMAQGFAGGTAKPQAIAGIPEDVENDKIHTAIARLKKHDNNLGDDLLKLADMADTNPGNFKFLISMLRK